MYESGENPYYLPFVWAFMIKIVTPLIIFVLFAFNVYNDISVYDKGYPTWTTVLFGWVPCVLFPCSLILYGATHPMDMANAHKLFADEEPITGSGPLNSSCRASCVGNKNSSTSSGLDEALLAHTTQGNVESL